MNKSSYLDSIYRIVCNTAEKVEESKDIIALFDIEAAFRRQLNVLKMFSDSPVIRWRIDCLLLQIDRKVKEATEKLYIRGKSNE